MYLPKPYKQFESQYPGIAKIYEELGVKCQSDGPLDSKPDISLTWVLQSVRGHPEQLNRTPAKRWSRALLGKSSIMHFYLLLPR